MIPSGRQPFQVALVALALLSGIAGLLVPGSGSRTIQELLPVYAQYWSLGLVVSSTTVLIGLVLQPIMSLLVERAGLVMLAVLFLAYGGGVIFVGGLSRLTGGLIIIGFGVASAARVWQITRGLRTVKKAA